MTREKGDVIVESRFDIGVKIFTPAKMGLNFRGSSSCSAHVGNNSTRPVVSISGREAPAADALPPF